MTTKNPMTKVTVQPDCGNSPKMAFLRDFETAFVDQNRELILDALDENVRWEMVGVETYINKNAIEAELDTMLDGSIATMNLTQILTHGDVGAVQGEMTFKTGQTFGFCDVFEFTSHGKDAKIKSITAFVIEKPA